MAVYQKITGDDIINGLATVGGGCAVPAHYDRPDSQHLASGDALRTFRTLDGRYLRGDWSEHRGWDTPSAADAVAAASGVAASFHLSARENRQHVLGGVAYSYDAAPAGGELRVESPSGVVIFRQSVHAQGPGDLDWPQGLPGGEGSDLLVVLAGTGAAKNLSIKARRTE